MKLKAIDVSGFKSFADKIKLEFDHGITAVVGPNGSGKSNIADAVRWVLGEQSVKTLRGGKMEDVIFNGTQSRKAQGVASVTLVIDNSDHSLLMEAEEVAITRKLYRSGESEYKINENTVRLKDVNELFMDTGIGKDGYAIIGQGKVNEIVSARSKERREIFEEAAGISKFRYRKSEAEKQLLQSEDNLSRLRDILSEIENRVGPLKLQSEKAKKFLALADEKKSLEISVSIHNLAELKQKNAKTEDNLLLATQQLNDAQQEADESEAQFSEQQEQGKKLNIEIDDLRHDLEEITEDISLRTSKNAVLNNDISHFEASVNEALLTLNKTGLSKEELFNTKENLEIQLDEKQQQLDIIKKEFWDIKNSVSIIMEKQAENQKQSQILKLKRAGIFDAIESAKVEFATTKSIIEQSSQRLSQIDNVKQETAEQLQKTEADIESCKKLFSEIEQHLLSLKNEISGYNLKKASKEKKLLEFSEKLTSAQNELNGKRQRAKLLTDLENAMEGFGQSVKYIINAQRTKKLEGIIGTVSSLLTTDEKYVLAIETALGASMQNIVTDTQKNAKSAIFMLKNQKAGRATFLPLDTIKSTFANMGSAELQEGYIGKASELITFDPKFKDIFGWLLGRIIIASDLNSATLIAKKTGYRFRIVTLDGQVVNAGGSMTGGFSGKSSGILSRKSEIERLNTDANKLETVFSQIKIQHAEIQNEVKALDAEIFAIEARKKTLNEDKIRCETHEKSLLKQREEKTIYYDSILKETKDLNDKIREIKEKGQQSDELFQNLNNELTETQLQLSKYQEERNELLTEREQVLQDQTSQNAQIAILENTISSLKTEIEKLNDIINSKEREREDLNLKIESLKQQAENARTEIQNLESEIKNKNDLILILNQKTAQKLNERTQNELKITKLREKERETLANRDNYYKEVVRLTQQRDSVKTQISGIIASLYDQYELTLSAAEELAKPIDDISVSNRHLNEIKNRIKSLGSVNVGAIEEYDEVSLRFEELSRQIEDVTKAKKELSNLINELTSQMCDIFSDKFRKIGDNFSSIFKELFGGGQAKLSLSDPNDVLESGIEISVTPPGKVIKNLASLSGGEQSFVAIAIFFAILKVNPSPFCLMDEIEAALDDVNVAKFANYLHTLTDKTQFITITHRRGTMEEANVLYGVTMQEEGVSKLLKLEADNIDKNFYK